MAKRKGTLMAAAGGGPAGEKSAAHADNRVSQRRSSDAGEAYRIGDLLHSAAIHLLRKVRAKDRSSGIGPAQLSALSVLVFGGARSLKELAEAEQVRAPTMSRIVVGLERAGLVRRKPTEDKRRMTLEATARGIKILERGRRLRVEMLVGALQELDSAGLREADAAAEFLRRFIAKLN
jgi:DNA-binding MarR family transcriptional regulator